MKAIKIDVRTKKVYEIELEEGLQAIYDNLNCNTFSCPIQYENDDCMYCDDEALLFPELIEGAFIYPDWSYPIVSNALIIGTDEDGNSVDCKSTIEEISKGIKFIDKNNDNLIRYINQFI
jgi:hypothetical protein